MSFQTTVNISLCPYIPLSSYNWKTSLVYDTGCYSAHLPLNPTVYCLFTAFHAITLWTALGLILEFALIFRRWNTIYFWALTTTAFGIIIFTVWIDLTLFTHTNSIATTVLNTFAWPCMVVGFSLVLYSRLHLVLPDRKILRIVLIVILGNAFVFYTPVVIAEFMGGDNGQKIYEIISYFKVVFSIQEATLSGLYTYLFYQFMREPGVEKPHGIKKMLYLLIAAQLFSFACDVAVSTLLYFKLYLVRKMVLTFTYAIKLKAEFLVLNRLVVFTQGGQVQLPDLNTDLVRVPKLPFSIQSAPLQDSTDTVNIELAVLKSSASGSQKMQSEAGTSVTRRDSLEEVERRYLGQFRSGDVP